MKRSHRAGTARPGGGLARRQTSGRTALLFKRTGATAAMTGKLLSTGAPHRVSHECEQIIAPAFDQVQCVSARALAMARIRGSRGSANACRAARERTDVDVRALPRGGAGVPALRPGPALLQRSVPGSGQARGATPGGSTLSKHTPGALGPCAAPAALSGARGAKKSDASGFPGGGL